MSQDSLQLAVRLGLRIPCLLKSSAEKARFRSCCGRVIPMLSFVLVFGAQTPKNGAL
jgi:hypothetical protein